MDIVGQNTVVPVVCVASLGIGATAGWTGRFLGNNVFPQDVADLVTPLLSDLDKLKEDVRKLKEIPGATAAMQASSVGGKTKSMTIAEMLDECARYKIAVQELESKLKGRTPFYLYLREEGRKLYKKLNELREGVAELRDDVASTTTHMQNIHENAREYERCQQFGVHGTTPDGASLMSVLDEARDTFP